MFAKLKYANLKNILVAFKYYFEIHGNILILVSTIEVLCAQLQFCSAKSWSMLFINISDL